jgi:hypothetical protein
MNGSQMSYGWAEVGQPRVRRPHADVPPPSPPQVEEEASERQALFPASASGALGGGVRALNGGGVGGARVQQRRWRGARRSCRGQDGDSRSRWRAIDGEGSGETTGTFLLAVWSVRVGKVWRGRASEPG